MSNNEKKENRFTFEDFREYSNLGLSNLIANSHVGPITMWRFWKTYHREKWFLESLNNLSMKSIVLLNTEQLLCIFPFTNRKKVIMEFNTMRWYVYNQFYQILMQYHRMERQPYTIPSALAKALLIRFSDDDNSMIDNPAYKEMAAIYLKGAIDDIYKYHMFTKEEFSHGDLRIDLLRRYRFVHPTLRHMDYSSDDAIAFNYINILPDHLVKSDTDIKEAVLYILTKIKPEDELDTSILSCEAILSRIPRMNGRNIRKIRRHIDDSPYVVSLPSSIMTGSFREYRESIRPKTNQQSCKSHKELLIDRLNELQVGYLNAMYDYEELMWYYLASYTSDEKVRQWLQGDNQTRRRLMQ